MGGRGGPWGEVAEGRPGSWLRAGLGLQGEALLQKLQQLLDRNISLAVATSCPTLVRNSTDLQDLAARGRCPLCAFCAGGETGLTCWHHGQGQGQQSCCGVLGKHPVLPRTPGGEEPWATSSSESSHQDLLLTKSRECHLPRGVTLGGLRVLLSPAALGRGARGNGHNRFKGRLWAWATWGGGREPVNASAPPPVKRGRNSIDLVGLW